MLSLEKQGKFDV